MSRLEKLSLELKETKEWYEELLEETRHGRTSEDMRQIGELWSRKDRIETEINMLQG